MTCPDCKGSKKVLLLWNTIDCALCVTRDFSSYIKFVHNIINCEAYKLRFRGRYPKILDIPFVELDASPLDFRKLYNEYTNGEKGIMYFHVDINEENKITNLKLVVYDTCSEGTFKFVKEIKRLFGGLIRIEIYGSPENEVEFHN